MPRFKCPHCGFPFDAPAAKTVFCPRCRGPVAQFKGGGCFIASEVYGANATQTNTLRLYRDQILLKSKIGCITVALYYLTSPKVAQFLYTHRSYSVFVRQSFLDSFVNYAEICLKQHERKLKV